MDGKVPLKSYQILDDVIVYLDKNDARKAYRSGKSLLNSEHLSIVMTHIISNNIRHTFLPFFRMTTEA